MALTGSGTISMGDMRTEFGISGAISMSDLYRGGSEVPTTKEITDGISSVSYSGVSGATLGYSNRYMYGNLHTYSGGIGAGGTWAYGFMYNTQALSSVFNSTLINNGGITGSNYVSGGYANHILFHMGTSASGQTITETLTATMGRAGTYYVLGYSLNAGQLGIEVDTGSGFSTVYALATQSTTQTSRYTFNASVGDKIRFTLKGLGEEIVRYYYLSTSSSAEDKTLTVNTSVPSGESGDTEFQFSDLYGATA
jgi:hypothetical protein